MMRVDTMQPGERYTLQGRNVKTNKPSTTAFTLVCLDWFPSPTKAGVLYHGALAISDEGLVGILDFITLEFCQPLLALPAPRQSN